MESLVCLYMVLCTIFQTYPDDADTCKAQPPQITSSLVIFVFVPFYLGRLYAYFFLKKPKAVVIHIVFGFLLNQLLAGIWEIHAFYRLFELGGCKFNIGYFNLIFYFLYMLQSLLSWLLIPLFALRVYYKAAADVEKVNLKIQKIDKLPTQVYSHAKFSAQKSCAICMDDFNEDSINIGRASRVTWLSCDPRHFFHSGCIKFWLHRQSTCPLCKAEETYSG